MLAYSPTQEGVGLVFNRTESGTEAEEKGTGTQTRLPLCPLGARRHFTARVRSPHVSRHVTSRHVTSRHVTARHGTHGVHQPGRPRGESAVIWEEVTRSAFGHKQRRLFRNRGSRGRSPTLRLAAEW